ncbi:unnamed protein product, partial [Arctogadus glacialis]
FVNGPKIFMNQRFPMDLENRVVESVWRKPGQPHLAQSQTDWPLALAEACTLSNQCARVKPAVTTHSRRHFLPGKQVVAPSHVSLSTNVHSKPLYNIPTLCSCG